MRFFFLLGMRETCPGGQQNTLLTLGNNIYTKKKFLANIYPFIVNKKNGRKRSEICSESIIKTPKL